MRHALDVTKSSLPAVLDYALEGLLAATHRGMPQSVEGIVHPILQQGDAQQILRNIYEIGVERPKIQPLLARVANVKSMPGHFMHHLTPAIMLNRIFSLLTTSENACIGRPLTPLQAPVGDPTVKQSVDHSSMHSGWHSLCKLKDSSMNAPAINTRRTCQTIGNTMPPCQLVPNTVASIRFHGSLDGYRNPPLELGPNFSDTIIINIPDILPSDVLENVNSVDAHAMHFSNLVDQVQAVAVLIPGLIECKPLEVVGFHHASSE